MQAADRHQETLVTRERALLESLMEFLTGFGAPPGDVELLRQTLSDMGDPFLLVIVGEFNAGKSAFINALFGEEVTLEGSLPTTARVTVLKHSPEPYEKEGRQGILEKGHPSELLRVVSVVDTPGTNAVIREHEEISREFVPRSDLVLFVTSAERPFTQSEREYMQLIRDWGKKIVLVVNKVDVLPPEEVDGIRRFVQEQVRSLLNLTPPVFMVSSRGAKRAKATEDDSERERMMRESGFEALEGYVANLMGEKNLMSLKLHSPLGVAEQLVRRYRFAAEERSKLLGEDAEMVRSLEDLLETYREDIRRDFDVRLAQITLAIGEINERGDRWFEEHKGGFWFERNKGGFRSSFGGLFGRRGGADIQERFLKEVVADTGETVDRQVRELINWLVYRNVKQWRTLVDYVELHRKADLTRRLTGKIVDDFEQRRDGLLQAITDTATSTVENYDYQREAERLVNSLRGAAARTAAAEADALGLDGETTDELTRTETLDITGTTLSVLVAGLDLSGRRKKARSEFREQTAVLRERLNAAVQRQLEAELEASVERMREAITPYGNFVNSELRRMETIESILSKLDKSATSLEESIDAPVVEADPAS